MIRGTTPDYILTVDADLSDKTVYVTISQGRTRLTLTGDELSIATDAEGSTIAIRLTQEQTLGLAVGRAEVQVKFIGADGVTQATDIQPMLVHRALLERVVEYVWDDPSDGAGNAGDRIADHRGGAGD